MTIVILSIAKDLRGIEKILRCAQDDKSYNQAKKDFLNFMILQEDQMTKVTIKLIKPSLAKKVCRAITATLPEWFGIPEANARYEQGMVDRLSFAACIEDQYVGLITLEFPFPHTAHIYWMGVDKSHHGKHIGRKLLMMAENYCQEHRYSTLVVETVSPKQNDLNYQKTYAFYEQHGFKPLFEMRRYTPQTLMVYMQKTLSLDDFYFIDLTHTLSSDVPHWGIDVGFKYNARYINSTDSTEDVKFHVQRLEMSAGIGTHMDAPSHCFENASGIDAIPLQSLIAMCRVIDVSSKIHEQYSVTADDILHFEEEYGIIPKGSCILIYTGWGQRWHQPEKYRNEKIFPSISIEAAKLLLSRDIVGLGIDTLSPDRIGSNFPVHQLILGAGKYIIENVSNANKLDPIGSYVFALPIKVKDGTEAPIRLVGMKRKPLTSV